MNIGEDTCATWPRWALGSVEWLGYALAVFEACPDDERSWAEVEGYHRHEIGGSAPTVPDCFRADPSQFRDPLTWCKDSRAPGAMQ